VQHRARTVLPGHPRAQRPSPTATASSITASAGTGWTRSTSS
jgi:hypothetical protein